MAAFQTLIHYEKEWNELVERKNVAELAKAMEYVVREWNLTGYIGVSGLAHFPKADLVSMASLYEGCPIGANKDALVAFIDAQHNLNRAKKREELQTLLTSLNQGSIPVGIVETMIHTLDMAW